MQGKLDAQRIDGNQSSVACWSLDMRGYVRLCGCAEVFTLRDVVCRVWRGDRIAGQRYQSSSVESDGRGGR